MSDVVQVNLEQRVAILPCAWLALPGVSRLICRVPNPVLAVDGIPIFIYGVAASTPAVSTTQKIRRGWTKSLHPLNKFHLICVP
jgi:hypothetical protein